MKLAGHALMKTIAAVVIFTALGMIHHAVVSNAMFGGPTTNPWYFMTALPFLFVLLVRGLEANSQISAGLRLNSRRPGDLSIPSR